MTSKITSLTILSLGVFLILGCAQQQNKTNQQSSSQIDTSNWKTYVSELQGYEISFPRTYKCTESRFCPDKNDKIPFERIALVSEDADSLSGISPTLRFETKRLEQKPSEMDLFDYITFQANQDNKRFNESVKILNIHDTKMLNGHKMVKVETIQDLPKGYDLDFYAIEKDPSNYLRILVSKLKPEEAKKRTAEIDAIISSFKFIK